MEKVRRWLIKLFFLLLLFSVLRTSRALFGISGSKDKNPTIINLKDQDQDQDWDQNQVKQEAGDHQMKKMMREEFRLWMRMDLESNDYPGSGANNRHDPKPPGRP